MLSKTRQCHHKGVTLNLDKTYKTIRNFLFYTLQRNPLKWPGWLAASFISPDLCGWSGVWNAYCGGSYQHSYPQATPWHCSAITDECGIAQPSQIKAWHCSTITYGSMALLNHLRRIAQLSQNSVWHCSSIRDNCVTLLSYLRRVCDIAQPSQTSLWLCSDITDKFVTFLSHHRRGCSIAQPSQTNVCNCSAIIDKSVSLFSYHR